MTWFSARNISISTVPVKPEEIWHLISDPAALAALTPLVRSIEASGPQWRWTLNGIEGLGLNVEAVFTERMEFSEQRQIVFTHEPVSGPRERAGVEGVYDLTPQGPEATDLKVDLTLSVDLPMPRLSRQFVEPFILSTMRTTGRHFAANLYKRLGLDPSAASMTELSPPK